MKKTGFESVFFDACKSRLETSGRGSRDRRDPAIAQIQGIKQKILAVSGKHKSEMSVRGWHRSEDKKIRGAAAAPHLNFRTRVDHSFIATSQALHITVRRLPTPFASPTTDTRLLFAATGAGV